MSIEHNFIQEIIREYPRNVNGYERDLFADLDVASLMALQDWYRETDQDLKAKALCWLWENRKWPVHWFSPEGWCWDMLPHASGHELVDYLPWKLFINLQGETQDAVLGKWYETAEDALADFYHAFGQWENKP